MGDAGTGDSPIRLSPGKISLVLEVSRISDNIFDINLGILLLLSLLNNYLICLRIYYTISKVF